MRLPRFREMLCRLIRLGDKQTATLLKAAGVCRRSVCGRKRTQAYGENVGAAIVADGAYRPKLGLEITTWQLSGKCQREVRGTQIDHKVGYESRNAAPEKGQRV